MPRWLVASLAPGFGETQLQLGTHLMQLGLLALPFSGVGVLLNAVFHAEKQFVLPAVSTKRYNTTYPPKTEIPEFTIHPF